MNMESTDDSILYEDSFETMKVAELKAQLKARNLPTSGLRSELIARLQEAVSSSKDSVDDEEEEEDEDDEDDLEGDSTLEIPSQVSLFADSQLSEDLQDEILDDSDLPIKHKQDSFGSLMSSTPIFDSSLSPIDIKVTKTSLKPLKRTTTIVPSNGAPSSEKKVCLNRAISTPSVLSDADEKKSMHIPVMLDSNISSTVKSVSLTKPMSSQEKLELRAKRFNLSSTGAASVTVTGNRPVVFSTTKSNITPISFNTPPDMEKLKKRAERFGVVSSILKKIEEKDKVKQRMQRFSSSGTVTLSKDDEEKRNLRMQRFGET